MEELDAQFKSSSLGVISIIVLIATVLGAALYNYIDSPVARNHNQEVFAGAATAGLDKVIWFLAILFFGCLWSLSFAVVSLVANEKKIFPLVTFGLLCFFLAGLLFH